MAAYCREWVFLFDKGKGVFVSALGSHLKISLYGNMGGTGCLTGCSPCVVTVNPVVVPVIFIPFFRPPFHCIRQFLFGVGYLPLFCAKLLPQFYRPGRTVLHTAAAGHTVLFFHSRHIGGTGHVWGVKKLGSPQCIAHVYITVTDGKNFVMSVDIGYLMDKTIILRLL